MTLHDMTLRFTFQDDLTKEDWQREIDEVMTEEDVQNGSKWVKSQQRVHHGSAEVLLVLCDHSCFIACRTPSRGLQFRAGSFP